MTQEEVRRAAAGIRLLALDADGTSLTTDKRCTDRTVRAVNRLIQKGCLVVPASGRGYEGLLEKVFPFSGIRYVISEDGAFVTECATGRHLWDERIPCRTAARLAGKLLLPDTSIYYHREDGSFVRACQSEEAFRKIFPGRRRPSFEGVMTEGMDQYILREGRDISKMGLWFSRPDGFSYFEPIIEREYPELSCFRADVNALEFTSRRTSKGEALKALASHLGLDRTQICAIGDNGNDIAMLEFAGLGIAMGNAIESVKEKADFIIGSNDEEGVAKFLETYFLDD